jgi:hypothetical protein
VNSIKPLSNKQIANILAQEYELHPHFENATERGFWLTLADIKRYSFDLYEEYLHELLTDKLDQEEWFAWSDGRIYLEPEPDTEW